MVKKRVAVFGLALLMAVLPATASAQDAKNVLSATMKAMGAENLIGIQYSGAGSSSGVRVKSYKRELDFNAMSSRLEWVRVEDKIDRSETQTISATSPWDMQFDLWSSPHGFLKGAMANNATVSEETLFGENYNLVSYAVQNHKVNGYIDSQNMVYKVETWLPNDVHVESIYRDYKDFGGLKFPTIIIQKQRGENTLILIVDAVSAKK